MDKAYARMLTIAGSGFIGVFIAAIFQIMYVNGMIIDELVGEAVTLPELMAIVVVIFLLLGVIIAAVE